MGFELKVDDELSLRLVEPEHAEEIYTFAVANRDHLAPWMVWACPEMCLDDFQRFAEDSLTSFARRKKLEVSIMCSGELVGGCGWHSWNRASLYHDHLMFSSAEIGFWLGEHYQGRGIATRSVRALTTLAFESYGIRRLVIDAEPENRKSWAVAERLGYQHEGTLRSVARHDDRVVDLRLYSMLAQEWKP